MRRILISMLLILVFISGCSTKEGKVVNVLNWSSYIPSEVLYDFEKEAGIKVNYSTYSSNEELLAKISSAKKGTYDLIFPSDYMVQIMKDRQIIEKLDKSKLSNVVNLNTKYMNLEFDENNEYSIPFLVASTVISVNRSKVNKFINSYNDLLDPCFKNSIVLVDDQRIIIGMALLALGYDMNTVDQKALNKALDWLKELKPNIKGYDSDSPKNYLISEEATAAVIWNAEAALASEENSNIETVFPMEGFAISMDNFAIPSGARNKEAAYKFIDYILRPEVMKKIVESYPYKSVNIETDKILSDTYLNNPASNIDDDLMLSEGYFVKNIGSFIKYYDRVWMNLK